MNTNITNSGKVNSIDSSLQFKALDEIVSMIYSLTAMMNENLPSKVTYETAHALGDLNLLVANLRNELNMVKLAHTKMPATELSNLAIGENGLLKYIG